MSMLTFLLIVVVGLICWCATLHLRISNIQARPRIELDLIEDCFAADLKFHKAIEALELTAATNSKDHARINALADQVGEQGEDLRTLEVDRSALATQVNVHFVQIGELTKQVALHCGDFRNN